MFKLNALIFFMHATYSAPFKYPPKYIFWEQDSVM